MNLASLRGLFALFSSAASEAKKNSLSKELCVSSAADETFALSRPTLERRRMTVPRLLCSLRVTARRGARVVLARWVVCWCCRALGRWRCAWEGRKGWVTPKRRYKTWSGFPCLKKRYPFHSLCAKHFIDSINVCFALLCLFALSQRRPYYYGFVSYIYLSSMELW